MKHNVINWNRAIATNRSALALVVEEIFGLLELALGSPSISLPPLIATMARRLLRPAESALRRLLIIMARDVKVKLPQKCEMPKGLKIISKDSGRMAFRLYDSRIRFKPAAEMPEPKHGPRIHFFFDVGPLVPQMRPQKKPRHTGVRLIQRFTALKLALETLPRQAKRMALWRLRQEAKANAKFKSPLRPGQPPGHQKRPRFKIDDVLQACHGLAHEVLYGNTS